eukprot:COSAG02_NODE_32893_length_508_cov_10.369193_1_plen_98_part_10
MGVVFGGVVVASGTVSSPPFWVSIYGILANSGTNLIDCRKTCDSEMDLTGRCIKSHCVSTWDRDYSYPDLGACWLSSCHTSCRILAQPLKAAHLSVRV